MTDKTEQVHKLAKTLVNSGLASNLKSGMEKAKQMLKIEDDEDLSKLPKAEELSEVTLHDMGADGDKALRQLLDEEADRVYNGKS